MEKLDHLNRPLDELIMRRIFLEHDLEILEDAFLGLELDTNRINSGSVKVDIDMF